VTRIVAFPARSRVVILVVPRDVPKE